MSFRIGDVVQMGTRIGTITDVGTILIQVKTTDGILRVVCPWELGPVTKAAVNVIGTR